MCDGAPLTYTVPEAAAILGVSVNHAYALAAKGQLPGCLHLGRRVRVSRPALLAALGVIEEQDVAATSGGETGEEKRWTLENAKGPARREAPANPTPPTATR